jgi:hypothetical protein
MAADKKKRARLLYCLSVAGLMVFVLGVAIGANSSDEAAQFVSRTIGSTGLMIFIGALGYAVATSRQD